MSRLARWLEDPARRRRLRRWGLAALVVIVLAEIVLPQLFPGEPHHFAFEGLPAFGSLYGLASCVLIVVVSKWLGKAWLMRSEEHYDR